MAKNYISEQMKYVRNSKTDKFLIFHNCGMSHEDGYHIHPDSAGFLLFYIENNKLKVDCYGESVSLKLKSSPEDSEQISRFI